MYTLQVRVVRVGKDGKVKGAVREYVGGHITLDEELALRSLNAVAEMVDGVLPDWGFIHLDEVEEDDPTVGIRRGWMA